MNLRFKEYRKNEMCSEGFLRDLAKAFKSGYDEEKKRIDIDNKIKAELKKLEKLEKKKHCERAEKQLIRYKKSIYRNSESTKAKIAELEDALQYCSNLGTITAFIKTNWTEGEDIADNFWDEITSLYSGVS